MFLDWTSTICGIFIASFGLYMIGYETPLMPKSLNAMIKWKAPLAIIRVIGVLVMIGGVLMALRII